MKRPLLNVTIVIDTKPLCISEIIWALQVPAKAPDIHPVVDKACPRQTQDVSVNTKGADTLAPKNDPG